MGGCKDQWIAAHEKANQTLAEDLDNFITEMLDLGFDGGDIRDHVGAALRELLKALKL